MPYKPNQAQNNTDTQGARRLSALDQDPTKDDGLTYRGTTPVESERRCPACDNKLSQVSETETQIGLALGQIKRIGTALCEACGQAWMYADVPETADADEIRTKLDQIAELGYGDLSDANDAA